jgi:apolipoprotein N-acyltransferase
MILRPRKIGLQTILAAALGAATVFGFAPFYFSWLPLVTFAGLILLWQNVPGKWHAALLGLAFGLGLFGAGVNWIYVSLHDFGGMPAPLAVFCTFLLSLILAAYPTIVGFIQALVRAPNSLHFVLVIPALWAVVEWLCGWLMTGFPWLSLGYAQAADGPLAGYAPLLGVYGVSLLTAVSAGLIVCVLMAIVARRWVSLVASAVALAIVVASGFTLTRYEWTKPFGAPVSVSLVQGNITQDIKWKPETLASTLTVYRDLTLASKSKLIILPETAFPVFLEQLPEEYLAEFDAHAKKLAGDILIGVPETTGPTTYHNSVLSFGVSPPQTYRKSHLVPFSEFIPFKWLIGWVYDDLLNMPLADFTAGEMGQAPFAIAGQQIAMTNCYEDLFGEEIIRKLPHATMLANVSNDAWFGRSWGPQQHLQISQMRALEMGRYMLRSTNTGVTAIIDHKGRVVSRAPEFTRMSLDGAAQGYGGATPYVRFGNFAVVGLSIAILAIAWALRKRTARRDPYYNSLTE